MAMSDKVFRPVIGTDDQIKAADFNAGYVYFATDKGKIYLDSEAQAKQAFGGSGSSLYYSSADGLEPVEGIYTIQRAELDDQTVDPVVNDLIINSDGKFFKVQNTYTDYLECSLVAVSGGGGGGGGTAGSAKIERITDETVQIVENADCPIQYTLTAQDSSGEAITRQGTAKWYVGGILKYTELVYPGTNSYNIGNYLSSGTNIVKLQISIDTGGETNTVVTKTWTVNVIILKLTWDYSITTQHTANEPFDITWTPIGNVAKMTHILIDNIETVVSSSTSGTEQTYTFEDGLPHGKHTCEIYLTAVVNGTTIESDHIYNEMLFIEENNTTPIIVSNTQDSTIEQYTATNVNYAVYTYGSLTSNVYRYIDNTAVSSEAEITDRNLQTWSYTPQTSGLHKLKISCGDVERTISVNVTEIELGDRTEATGYTFKLKSNNFNSNNELKAWAILNNVEFSDNFDWDNGGLKQETLDDGTVRPYICIKNGSTMTINYNLFEKDAVENGKEFKIIFKATNCYDFNAQILSCFQETRSESGEGIGLQMYAQNAYLSSSNTANMLDTKYCEDNYIEYEFDIHKLETGDTGKRYVMPWMDGIPAGIMTYTTDDSFKQPSAKPITIGSNDCDVYIYLIKIYERHLSDIEHLNNFVVDAPTGAEMVARYKRNNVYDENGEISPTLVAKNNPNCQVHVYEISRMTTTKDDVVSGGIYTQYYNDTTPYLYATNVDMKVQGTSSSKYGISAFNNSVTFNDGFDITVDGTTTHSDTWSMDDEAIGINYFTNKVNVASCEQANNALNQEWYNKFQPYICEHRANTEGARDTMEFKNGVMFVIDHNQTVDSSDAVKNNVFKEINGYVANPYAKMYSICNMGNDKKNKTVFHDTDNAKELCIEVTDNQSVGQWMAEVNGAIKSGDDVTYIPLTNIDTPENLQLWKTNMNDTDYDVRYSKNKLASDDYIATAWFRLVKWMTTVDPNPYDAIKHPHGYTEEELETPVTYKSYTFKGYTSSYDGYTPDQQILKGYTVDDASLATTFTKDTKEYRIAKFLNECEDYLIMDSFTYHYLFIERHTMVDNVAKNTFWGTEDGVHWNVVKDYDNDTADGTNNDGFFAFDYGCEPDDLHTSEEYVFNAHDSVWFSVFRSLEFTVGEYMYRHLPTKKDDDGNDISCWDHEAYIKAFEDWQGLVPEACWIEDYYRKYLRPYEVYGTNAYFERLAGGQKKHQRKQFETYQHYYMDSKYFGNTTQADYISLRANSIESLQGKSIPVTTYADCYVNAGFGTGSARGTKYRVKRGEQYSIPISMAGAQDATCYFYLASYYTTMEDISVFKPQSMDISGAKHLRILNLGSDAIGYSNTNMTVLPNFNKNSMMEELYVQNYVQAASPLLIDSLTNLKKLNILGTPATAITFATNGLLQESTLQSPTSLNINNLSKMENDNFIIKDYTKLTTLSIKNTPNINSSTIVSNSTNLQTYCLTNVNWTITSNSLNDNEVTKIDVLETLLAISPISGETKATALTGTLTLAVSGATVNGYNIYKKYIDEYPNLNIAYDTDVMTVVDYPKEVQFKDGNDSVYYEFKVKSGDTLTQEQVDKVGTPAKAESPKYIYTFTGWLENGSGELIPTENLVGKVITDDTIFEPQYDSTDRYYTMTFITEEDSLGNIVDSGTIELQFKYEEIITQPIVTPYRDDSDESIDPLYGYVFLGWSLIHKTTVGTKEDCIDLSKIITNQDYTFYPIFKLDDVRNYPTSDELFEITTINIGEKYYNQINPAEGATLKGKIVIPNRVVDSEGQTRLVQVIGSNFGLQKNITGVYFTPDVTSVIRIMDNAFDNSEVSTNPNKLTYFEFPSSLQVIGSQAFRQCYDLKLTSVLNLANTKLTDVQSEAFYRSFYILNNNINISLPKTINSLGSNAFANSATGDLTRNSYYDKKYGTHATCMPIQSITFGGPNAPANLTVLGTTSLSGITKVYYYYDSTTTTAEEVMTLFDGYDCDPIDAYATNN